MTDPGSEEDHYSLLRLAEEGDEGKPPVIPPPAHWHPKVKRLIYRLQLSGPGHEQARIVFAEHLAQQAEYRSAHDFEDILSDDEDEALPMVGRRADGQRLFYRYAYNILWGPPQARKSWVAMQVVRQTVLSDHPQRCVYFDYEDSAYQFKRRLRMLGCGAAELTRPNSWGANGLGWPWVDYRSWPGDLRTEMAGEFGLLENLSGIDSPAIIVIDGVEAFCVAHGCDSNSNADWGTLVDEVLNPLCSTGAAVILIDHVPKGRNANTKYPIGASQKLARCRGAGYDVSRVSETASRLVLRKDTNGQLDAPLDATVAELVLEAEGVYSPKLRLSGPESAGAADRTLLQRMEKCVRALQDQPGLNTRQLIAAIGGGHTAAPKVIAHLVKDGRVEAKEEGTAIRHYLVSNPPTSY